MPAITKTAIELDRIRLYAYHGVFEQERIVGNMFEVSLKAEYPFEKAMRSDNLNDTVSYVRLYEIIANEMKVPSNLLENVAYRIIHAVTSEFQDIEHGNIKITKMTPPISGEMAGVSVIVEW